MTDCKVLADFCRVNADAIGKNPRDRDPVDAQIIDNFLAIERILRDVVPVMEAALRQEVAVCPMCAAGEPCMDDVCYQSRAALDALEKNE